MLQMQVLHSFIVLFLKKVFIIIMTKLDEGIAYIGPIMM